MATPFCDKCGKPVPADVTFCPNCGRKFEVIVQPKTAPSSPASSAPPSASPPPQPSSRKSWITKRNVAIAVVLIFLLLVTSRAVVPSQRTITATVTVTIGTVSPLEKYVTVIQTVTAQPTSAQTAGQGEWKTIKTFSGSASRDTEDFNVPTSYWRIVYTVEAENEQYAGFSVYIYPSGETARYVASVDFDKSGTETSYIRAGPGDFYISVLAANLRSWTIEVQIQQ